MRRAGSDLLGTGLEGRTSGNALLAAVAVLAVSDDEPIVGAATGRTGEES